MSTVKTIGMFSWRENDIGQTVGRTVSGQLVLEVTLMAEGSTAEISVFAEGYEGSSDYGRKSVSRGGELFVVLRRAVRLLGELPGLENAFSDSGTAELADCYASILARRGIDFTRSGDVIEIRVFH